LLRNLGFKVDFARHAVSQVTNGSGER